MTRKEYSNRDIQIENRLSKLEEGLEEIKTNHLPHLQEAIDSINARTWWILGTLILGFLTNVLFILIK